MMKHRVRGAALVEYAFLLVCVTGLAGGSMKLVHTKTANTANLASSGLTVTGGGSSGSSSKGGSASGGKPSGGGAASKPKTPKKGPKEIGANGDKI